MTIIDFRRTKIEIKNDVWIQVKFVNHLRLKYKKVLSLKTINNPFSSLQHEERLSRVFDEVMGLGDFAESSRGSATSSRSGGQDDTKGADETSGQEENQQVEEDDSNGSRQEEKMDEGAGEPSFPHISSPSSGQPSSFSMRTNEGGGGGSGGAAFDNALDGLPTYGPEEEEDEEEEDEDWHFALPMGSLEDVDMSKAKGNRSQTEEGNTNQDDPFPHEPQGEEEEPEREGSNGSANTSHSSQDPTPDNSRGTTAYTP